MISIIKVRDEVGSSIRSILNAIGQNGRKRVLNELGHEVQRITRLNFGSSGLYRGKQWARLSPAYAKQVGHSTPTDIKSGALYKSILVGTVKRNYIDVYTRNPYAASISFGDKKRNLPPRMFWPFEIYGTPLRQRLTLAADRQLYRFISRRFNVYSQGQLPYGEMVRRSTVQSGNPFTSNPSVTGL